MSVATTTTGERDAHASPMAPTVLAAPGPVVTNATPTLPVAAAWPSAAYAQPCSVRMPTIRTPAVSHAGHNARLCAPGQPEHDVDAGVAARACDHVGAVHHVASTGGRLSIWARWSRPEKSMYTVFVSLNCSSPRRPASR